MGRNFMDGTVAVAVARRLISNNKPQHSSGAGTSSLATPGLKRP